MHATKPNYYIQTKRAIKQSPLADRRNVYSVRCGMIEYFGDCLCTNARTFNFVLCTCDAVFLRYDKARVQRSQQTATVAIRDICFICAAARALTRWSSLRVNCV